MAEVVLLMILAVTMLGIFAFLYSQGYMISKSISAVAFVGSAKGTSAKFSSCSGYIKRVITFKEDGTYTFVLDAQLHKGDVSVTITDSSKKTILQLRCSDPIGSITPEKKKKYYLVIHFRSASGRYTLVQEHIST